MFATVDVRLGAIQNFLTLKANEELRRDPALVSSLVTMVGRRVLATSPRSVEAALRLENVLFAQMGEPPGSQFIISTVGVRSVSLRQAAAPHRQPFVANLHNVRWTVGSSESPLVPETQQVSVGTYIDCALELWLRVDYPNGIETPPPSPVMAFVILEWSWLVGVAPSDPFLLASPDGRGVAAPTPTSLRVASATTPDGMPLDPNCPDSGPLCRLVRDFQVPMGNALQRALRGLPTIVAGLAGLLPAQGTPINQAVYVTEGSPPTGGGPDPRQFRYVAQVTWPSLGYGRFPGNSALRIKNDQTRVAWRALLTDRPRGVIPDDFDVVCTAQANALELGMSPGMRQGVIANLSTIEFETWTGLLFQPATKATDEMLRAAGERLDLFRGSDASRDRFATVPQPWRDVVIGVAAASLDTVALTRNGPVPSAAARLDLLEKRLLAQLAARFEARAVRDDEQLPNNVTPPVALPSRWAIVTAFSATTFPGVGIDRTAYVAFRGARLLRANPQVGATPAEAAAAVATIRSELVGCSGFDRMRRTFSFVTDFSTGGAGPGAMAPGGAMVINDPPRGLDAASQAFAAAMKEARGNVSATDADGIARQRREIEAAREALFNMIRFEPGTTCPLDASLAGASNARKIRLLRAIDVNAGAPVRLPSQDGTRATLANNLQRITLERGPTVAVLPHSSGVQIRVDFALRLVGIIPVLEEDVLIRATSRVYIALIDPPGARPSTAARQSDRPPRSLQISIYPEVAFDSRIVFQVVGAVIGLAITGALLGALTGLGAPLALAPFAAMPALFSLLFSNDLSQYVGNVDPYLRPLLSGLLGAGLALPTPQIDEDPHRITYTIPNFDSILLSPSLTGASGALMVGATSVSTVGPRLEMLDGGSLRFMAFVPPVVTSAISNSPALLRIWNTTEQTATWRLCSLLVEARVRRNSVSLSGDPPPPSRAVVTLTATYTNLSYLTTRISSIRYYDGAFDGLIRAGIAAQTITVGASPPELLPDGSFRVEPASALTIVVTVPVAAWLNAVPRPTQARIVVTSDTGLMVFDFARTFRNIVRWEPFLLDLGSTRAGEILQQLEMQCTMADIARMLNIPVTDPFERFPLSSSLWRPSVIEDAFEDRSGRLGDLARFFDRRVPRPAPVPGDPRPIVDRPWLFGSSASPVPRLDSIADLALRALRPQPVTPSA